MSGLPMSPEAEARARLEEANRRVLAALFAHHGDRPPEPGCSAEAHAIRRALAAGRAAR